jgi:hypothetical protein
MYFHPFARMNFCLAVRNTAAFRLAAKSSMRKKDVDGALLTATPGPGAFLLVCRHGVAASQSSLRAFNEHVTPFAVCRSAPESWKRPVSANQGRMDEKLMISSN